MHVGAPCCGMNAAVRSFVRNCLFRGDTVLAIHDGVEGLVENNVSLAPRWHCFVLGQNLSSLFHLRLPRPKLPPLALQRLGEQP